MARVLKDAMSPSGLAHSPSRRFSARTTGILVALSAAHFLVPVETKLIFGFAERTSPRRTGGRRVCELDASGGRARARRRNARRSCPVACGHRRVATRDASGVRDAREPVRAPRLASYLMYSQKSAKRLSGPPVSLLVPVPTKIRPAITAATICMSAGPGYVVGS